MCDILMASSHMDTSYVDAGSWRSETLVEMSNDFIAMDPWSSVSC